MCLLSILFYDIYFSTAAGLIHVTLKIYQAVCRKCILRTSRHPTSSLVVPFGKTLGGMPHLGVVDRMANITPKRARYIALNAFAWLEDRYGTTVNSKYLWCTDNNDQGSVSKFFSEFLMMTTPIIPTIPTQVPFAVLPNASPTLIAPHTHVAHPALHTAISPGSLRNCIRWNFFLNFV